MAKLKTSPLELKMLLEEKKQIDQAILRIESGKRSYAEVMRRNEELLAQAEKNLNDNLTLQAGKKLDYKDLTFSEDGIEI